MSDKLIRKTYEATTKANDEDRTMVVKISSINPDRSRDIVRPKGAKIENYLRNPVVALSHDYRGLAIAKTEDIEVNDNDIVAKLRFPDKGVYPMADTVYELYKGGFMSAWSIGFIPLKFSDMEGGGKDFEEWELLEYSAVLVPDNPEALTMLRSKGIDTTDFETTIEHKTVIPYRDLGVAPEGEAWSGSDEIREADTDTLRRICTWYDAEFPDIKSSYKLPHHRASGTNPAIWRGVAAAMGALLGARGGVDIPDSDRQGVYNHLARHYAQFDKEAPEMRSYSPDELIDLDSKGLISIDGVEVSKEYLSDLIAEKKEGRILSSKNRKLIIDVVNSMGQVAKVLTDLLDATEPAVDDKKSVELAEALKLADVVIGKALRNYKRE